MIVTLVPKSQFAKNRLKEHGTRWVVLPNKNPFNSETRFLESVETGAKRWVASFGDPDFIVIKEPCNVQGS